MNRYRTARRLLSAAAAALLLPGAAACGGGDAAGDAAADAPTALALGPADVATAETAPLDAGVALTGTLEPYRVAELKAQVPGVVTALSVDRGSAVRAGQVLARIEAQGIQSQAAGAQSAVAAAQAQVQLAARQLESARTLHAAGAMSDLDLRAAEAQFQAAQAQLASARSSATGAAEQAGRTAVRAPFSGRVSARAVNEGEAVNPGQTLLTIVGSEELELRGQVPVDQASRVRQGQEATFSLTAWPGRTFTGTVARVDPVADPATRQVGVALRLPNPGGELIAGMFATGRVSTGGRTDAVVIPAAAVRGTGAQPYLLVVEADSVVRRNVSLGGRDEAAGRVAVARGLAAGERVIVSPGAVPEGAKVRVRDAAPAGREATDG